MLVHACRGRARRGNINLHAKLDARIHHLAKRDQMPPDVVREEDDHAPTIFFLMEVDRPHFHSMEHRRLIVQYELDQSMLSVHFFFVLLH